MPIYEWQGTAPFRDSRNGREIAPGETVDLDAHLGDPQKEMVRVGAPDSDPEPQGEDGEDAGAEPGESEAFDADAVADEHWNSVVSAVEDGEYDGHLDALEAADDRQSVQDAIAERRSELSG